VRFGVSMPEPLAPPFFPAGERPRGLGDGAMVATCPFDLALMPLVSCRNGDEQQRGTAAATDD
jgi:hypothetical protein